MKHNELLEFALTDYQEYSTIRYFTATSKQEAISLLGLLYDEVTDELSNYPRRIELKFPQQEALGTLIFKDESFFIDDGKTQLDIDEEPKYTKEEFVIKGSSLLKEVKLNSLTYEEYIIGD